MTKEEYHQQWIANCGITIKDHICPELIPHIMKHATADLARHMVEDPPDWRRWSASMHNLLAMFDEVYLESPITVEEKLARLQDKWQRSPHNHTPPPLTNGGLTKPPHLIS